MVAVTLQEPKASKNIITLRETIQFGRFRGCTGAELMKSGEGTSYLVWIFNNTDIQIEAPIVNTLAAQGLVKLDTERRNQKAGGAQLDTNKAITLAEWGGTGQMMVDAARAAARLEHCIKDSVPINPDRKITEPVTVRIERRFEPLDVTLEPEERERICHKFRQAIKRETSRMLRDIVG
ncbi:UNVERIFIED_ORG: hypothetical protein GCAPEGMB_00418 [Vibrio phage V07]